MVLPFMLVVALCVAALCMLCAVVQCLGYLPVLDAKAQTECCTALCRGTLQGCERDFDLFCCPQSVAVVFV